MFNTSKILVVDDEKDLTSALAAVLKSWGRISVVQAESVSEAKKVMEDSEIELIVSDVNMHSENGYDLIAYAEEHYPEVPVILMSGKVNIYDDDDCSQKVFKNIYAFFEKPFNFKELKDTVERALKTGKNQSRKIA